MNNKVHTALINALKVLSENQAVCRQDGYHALADDMMTSITEINSVLESFSINKACTLVNDTPKVAEGLDNNLYLVFSNSGEAGRFLVNLGLDEFSVPLHHFGGYENAILVDTVYHQNKDLKKLSLDNPLTEAQAWLRAISTWLLENDHDMKLPDGILDTDPLDIAERLHSLAH